MGNCMVTQTATVEGLNGEVQEVQLRMPMSMVLAVGMINLCDAVEDAVANRPRLSDVISYKDERYNLAFGKETGISNRCKNKMSSIKGNSRWVKEFSCMSSDDADLFSDLSWELLGRYMSNNTHLKEVWLNFLMNDSRMRPLFRGLTKSTSIEKLFLYNSRNENGEQFGPDAIRDMVPFLKNATKLLCISLTGNPIHTEGFEVLVNALDGGQIDSLLLDGCSIDDISSLVGCTLPNMTSLGLSGNNITSIPSLKNHPSLKSLDLSRNKVDKPLLLENNKSLRHLSLDSNGITDDDVEVFVDLLQHKTTLEHLDLSDNPFTERGLCALLRLLNDVSSIGSTLKSNHTLTYIDCPNSGRDFAFPRAEPNSADDTPTQKELRMLIKDATRINDESSNPGRDKVIQTQLNSTKRYELARILGTSDSLFSDDDTFLLPEVLALVGEEHGHNELYQLLIEVVPYLMSQ